MNAESAYRECLKKVGGILRSLGAIPVANIIDEIDDVLPDQLLDNVKDATEYYKSSAKKTTKSQPLEYDTDDDDKEEKSDYDSKKMVNIYEDDYVDPRTICKILLNVENDTFFSVERVTVRIKCYDGGDMFYPAKNRVEASSIIDTIKKNLAFAGVKFV